MEAAGDTTSFSIAVLNDMGYTNAQGTQQQLIAAAESGISFVWHGGDLSYADDCKNSFVFRVIDLR